MNLNLINQRTEHAAVLVEGCLGLSIMVFAWIIITYALYMADNRTRTLMAARHAAWYRAASGNNISADQLNNSFFFQNGVDVDVTYSQGRGIMDLFSSGGVPANAASYSGFNGIIATVSYGPHDPHSPTNLFPFSLLNTRVPLMPDSFLTNCVSVSSSCQWDMIGDTWNTPSSAWNGIKGLLSAAVGGAAKLIGL